MCVCVCTYASLSLPRMELPWLLAAACLFQWETKRERERERRLPQCSGSQRGLNCIMALLHRDFIKAIQSLVFEYCSIFGCSKVLRDLPFKSGVERQNSLGRQIVYEPNNDLTYTKKGHLTLWKNPCLDLYSPSSDKVGENSHFFCMF